MIDTHEEGTIICDRMPEHSTLLCYRFSIRNQFFFCFANIQIQTVFTENCNKTNKE